MTNNKSTEADRRKFATRSIWIVRSGHRRRMWVAVYDQIGTMLHVRSIDSTDRKDSFWISAHKLEGFNEWLKRPVAASLVKLTAQENADLDDLMADYDEGKTWTARDD